MANDDNRDDYLFDVIVTSLDSGSTDDRREAIWARWELLAARIFNSDSASKIHASCIEASNMYAQSQLRASDEWTAAAMGFRKFAPELAERIQSALMYVYALGDENDARVALTAFAIFFGQIDDIASSDNENAEVCEYPFVEQTIAPVDDCNASPAEEEKVREWFAELVSESIASNKSYDSETNKYEWIAIPTRSFDMNMARTIKPQVPRKMMLELLRLPDLDNDTLNAIQGTMLLWAHDDEADLTRLVEALVLFLYLHPELSKMLPKLDWQFPSQYVFAARPRWP